MQKPLQFINLFYNDTCNIILYLFIFGAGCNSRPAVIEVAISDHFGGNCSSASSAREPLFKCAGFGEIPKPTV